MTARDLFVSALRSAPTGSVDRLIGDRIGDSGREATLTYLQQLMSAYPPKTRQWIVANALWRVMARLA